MNESVQGTCETHGNLPAFRSVSRTIGLLRCRSRALCLVAKWCSSVAATDTPALQLLLLLQLLVGTALVADWDGRAASKWPAARRVARGRVCAVRPRLAGCGWSVYTRDGWQAERAAGNHGTSLPIDDEGGLVTSLTMQNARRSASSHWSARNTTDSTMTRIETIASSLRTHSPSLPFSRSTCVSPIPFHAEHSSTRNWNGIISITSRRTVRSL